MSLRKIRPALLRWYDENRRELPWRTAPGQQPDPYGVWLSEIMLQQTRVDVVRPYFERWLERFPTLQALADAPHDEVMKAWEGLGYYSRARNLHRAVREVVERYGGRVPGSAEAFGALPGVGRYTRGAVLSIAFDREEPVVDGNVRRVFARLTNQAEPRDNELWRTAAELVEGERPGDLNQALMELGATLCKPRGPDCESCPVRSHCAAFAAGTQTQRPLPRKQRPLPHERTATAVMQRGDAVLLARRPKRGRLGGLWEFPGTLVATGEDADAAASRAARETVGVEVRVERSLCSVDHVFTHVRVTYEAFLCSEPTGEPDPIVHDAVRWVPTAEIHRLALPRAQQRIVAMLLAETAKG